MDDPGLSKITGISPIAAPVSAPMSDELPELSALPTQDIPTAVRENSASPVTRQVPSQPAGRSRNLLLGLLLGAGALAGLPWLWLRFQLPTAVLPTAVSSLPVPPTSSPPAASPTDLLGHLPYAEAPAAELVPLSSGGGIMLHRAAAKKFEEMVSAAAADGVTLSAISGFRTTADQNMLFFDVKAERGEDATKRAAVSAPPGYSEHHTGYAVDIGDGDAPSADLQFGFDQTRAFKWLKENAAYYSFEMSFAKGNPMGVSYEPWHWRFVGDRQSLETFYRAREGTAPQPAEAAPSPAPSANSAEAGTAGSRIAKPQN